MNRGTVYLKNTWKTWLAVFVVLGTLIWFVRYVSPSVAKEQPANPSLMEEAHLIEEIKKGSAIWEKAMAEEAAAHTLRVKQQKGNAGYRHVLCSKFGKIVTATGSVIASEDCGTF